MIKSRDWESIFGRMEGIIKENGGKAKETDMAR